MKINNLLNISLLFGLILLISCKDKDADQELIGINVELIEIIDPPEIPAIYKQCLIQPKVLVKNTGVINIDSLGISYFVMIVDSIETKEYGPPTHWINTISPGEEVIISLNKWDTINGNTPLNDGTYLIYVYLARFLPTPAIWKERTFILEQ